MLDPFTLEGTYVRLEPLSEAHVPALVEAASEDRSNYQWAYVPDGTEHMADHVREALNHVAAGDQVAFATVRRGQPAGEPDRIVGSTRFCYVSFWQWPPGARHQRAGVPDVVDIGFTFLAASAQRTPVNTEAKLLMMTHAFEVWQVHRVALQRPTSATSDPGLRSSALGVSSTGSCAPTVPGPMTRCAPRRASPSWPRSGQR